VRSKADIVWHLDISRMLLAQFIESELLLLLFMQSAAEVQDKITAQLSALLMSKSQHHHHWQAVTGAVHEHAMHRQPVATQPRTVV
jgi:hypothetical protein